MFERAARIETPNGFITWVNAHQTGIAGYFSAGAGGGYLLSEGIFRWIYVQISDLTVTRRFLAYLFRREVEKQASKTTSHVLDRKISAELYDKFEPYLDNDVVIPECMSKTVADAATWLSAGTGAVVAVVGERGLGKTTFLKRATKDMAAGTHLYLVCGFGGFPSSRPGRRTQREPRSISSMSCLSTSSPCWLSKGLLLRTLRAAEDQT